MASRADHVAVAVGPMKRGRSEKEKLLGDEASEAKGKRPGLSWGRLFKEAAPVRWRLIFGSVFLFLSAASNLATPAIFGSVIDALARRDGAQLQSDVVLLVVVSVGGAIFALIRAFLFNSAGQIVVASLRQKLFL